MWSLAYTVALALPLTASGQTARRRPPQPHAPVFEVRIRPLREGTDNVTTIEVRERIDAPPTLSGPFSMRAAITYASVRGIADAIENLQLRDSIGVIPVARQDDAANRGGFPYYRHWRARRGVAFPVTATYRFRLPAGVPVVGPQFDARAHLGGFSAAGVGFLLLPEESSTQYALRVRWDLGDLPPGSIAVSTFGEGDFEVREAAGVLGQSYYMAGPLGRFRAQGTTDGFSATWLGTPPFNAKREMEWTARVHAFFRDFFRDTSTSTFRVFLRVLPGVPGTPGTALRSSFMLGTPSGGGDSSGMAPRETIAHEIVHRWATGLQGEPGANAWFNEGLATHYGRLLAMRADLFPVDSFLRSVNAGARAYYASQFKELSLDSLRKIGFSMGVGPGSAQNIPYLRGSLYFADVDARLRAASGGRRGLDDILVPMFARIRAGAQIGRADFVAALVKELGASAREQFESVIVRGDLIVPSSNAFGPCFERRDTRYASRGREFDGYEWVRVPGVPDEECKSW